MGCTRISLFMRNKQIVLNDVRYCILWKVVHYFEVFYKQGLIWKKLRHFCVLYSFQGGSYNKVKHHRSGGDKALCAFLTVLRWFWTEITPVSTLLGSPERL